MASNLWVLAGLVCMAGYARAFVHDSNGNSGDACGNENRRCVEGIASCNPVTGNCDCHNPPFNYGDGYVNCYKNNTFRTEVTNDPNVLTYNGNSIGLPLPCRYFWTHTVTWLKDRNRQRVGYCEFQAYAFHLKDKGKFFIGGYDVAIRITWDDGREKTMSIRKYGKAIDQDYYYQINETDNQYLPHGDWYDDIIDFHDPGTNLRIKCEFDDDNNLAIIHAKKCGIRIQFRPYDCYLRRNQPMIPHIAYEVNCAFHPQFLSQDKVVAIPPAADHGGMTIDDVLVPGLNREQTLVHRALHSMAVQNSPFPNPECAAAPAALANCNPLTIIDAFDNCMWILKKPRFIKCWDSSWSGTGIMGLFNRCIDVYCNNASCMDLIVDIVTSGCDGIIPAYPEVDHFVSGAMCP